MKKILLIVLLIPALAFSQKKTKGYGMFGVTGFIASKYDDIGGFTGSVGLSPSDIFTLGIGLDAYIIAQSSARFVQTYVDIRAFPTGLTKTISPFLSVQPGVVLYNKTTLVETKGSFAINLLGGIKTRSKRSSSGGFIALGYSNISFTANYGNESVTTKYGGIKASFGMSF